MVVRPEPIDVQGWRSLLHERRVAPEPPQVAGGGAVDRGVVRIGVRRQVDLRPGHVQEAERVARGQRTRLAGRHDIVRHGGDGRGGARLGTQGTKRMNAGHAVGGC